MVGEAFNDVVVALPHLRPVMAALDQARQIGEQAANRGPLFGDPVPSEVLGLARISVLDVDGLARALEKRYDGLGEETLYGGSPRPERNQPAMDRVLWFLRAGFAKHYCNWVPTLGKNRAVGWVAGMQNPDGSVGGAGEISHGGGGAPRALSRRPGWADEPMAVRPSGVQIGLVDTKMVSHDRLAGSWIGPYEGAGPDDAAMPAEQGHATFIAGLLRRFAPGVSLQVRPVLDKAAKAGVWDAAHRILEAGRSGIDVLNLSFVSYTEDGQPPMVLSAALDRLDPEIVVVAAAGNHGYLRNGQQNKAAWPAAFADVIAVGAAREDRDSEPAHFSSVGPWVDVLAPGENLDSTYLTGTVQVWRDPDGPGPAEPTRHPEQFGGFARWSGTSFAAALVSAMIARNTVPGRVPARQACATLFARARAEQLRRGLPEGPVLLNPTT